MSAVEPLKQYDVSAAVFSVLCRIQRGTFFVDLMYEENPNLCRRIADTITLLLIFRLVTRVCTHTYKITPDGEAYIKCVEPSTREPSELDLAIAILVHSHEDIDGEQPTTRAWRRKRQSVSKRADSKNVDMCSTIQSIMTYLDDPLMHPNPLLRTNRCIYTVAAVMRAICAISSFNKKRIEAAPAYPCLAAAYRRSLDVDWILRLPRQLHLVGVLDVCAAASPNFGLLDPNFDLSAVEGNILLELC